MRHGEVLGPHWPEAHLAERTRPVRWSLTAVDNPPVKRSTVRSSILDMTSSAE
ncbi:MAG: hypothetical protein QOI83_733 [Streptomycetaceae bacterium]|jgi:hypothetical protein|nr:hypothetical protein [Streptomycetaceae bacterium]